MNNLDSDPGAMVPKILLIILLTMVNAFFASAEMAIVSVNKSKVKKLSEEGMSLTKKTAADYGLLPRNKSKIWPKVNKEVVQWGTIWTDHISLMNALIESGVDITIAHDYSTRTITVTLPQKS